MGDELAARHGFTHLALGAMLQRADLLQEIGIDPDEMERARASGRTMTNLRLYPWLDARIRKAGRVVVDGYPRAQTSAPAFDELVRSLPTSLRAYALILNCPVAVSHPRLRGRGRADDDARIPLRDREYEMVQRPLLDLLPDRVWRVEIDASRSAAEVFADVEAALGLFPSAPRT